MPSSSTSSKNFSSIDQTVGLLQRAQFVTLSDFSMNLSTSYLCTGSRYNAENFISSTPQQTLLAMKISAFHNEVFVHNNVDKIGKISKKSILDLDYLENLTVDFDRICCVWKTRRCSTRRRRNLARRLRNGSENQSSFWPKRRYTYGQAFSFSLENDASYELGPSKENDQHEKLHQTGLSRSSKVLTVENYMFLVIIVIFL